MNTSLLRFGQNSMPTKHINFGTNGSSTSKKLEPPKHTNDLTKGDLTKDGFQTHTRANVDPEAGPKKPRNAVLTTISGVFNKLNITPRKTN